MDDPSHSSVFPRRKTKELKDHDRIALVAMLLGMASNGVLPHGALTKVGKIFDVNRDTARRLWKQATLCRSSNAIVSHEIVSKKHQRGRKAFWNREAIKDATKLIPKKKRAMYRSLLASLDIPKTTLYNMKLQLFKRHSSALKPTLTEEHKIARIDYALTMRDPNESLLKYSDMFDVVDVDEKWFYLTRDKECYILAIDKEPPKRHTKHKGSKAYLERKGVRIQQDGAKCHIHPDDEEWLAALQELAPGNKITLYNQPAQSPDLNINDLAFFRSIQALYYEAAPNNEEELIAAVLAAFRDYCPRK